MIWVSGRGFNLLSGETFFQTSEKQAMEGFLKRIQTDEVLLMFFFFLIFFPFSFIFLVVFLNMIIIFNY